MTPQGQAGAPAQQPGWFSRNWKWLLAVGCLVPMLCCGVFGVGTYFTVTKVIQGTPVFAEALEKANTNPDVTAALGQPVTPGMMLSGSVNQSGNTGTADFSIPIEGPKGKGTLKVEASMKGGDWTFQRLEAEVGGKTIDLLAGAPSPMKGAGQPLPDEPPMDAPPADEPMDPPPGDEPPADVPAEE